MGCPVLFPGVTLAADPLGPVGFRVWPLWTGFVLPLAADARTDWDLGTLRSTAKSLRHR